MESNQNVLILGSGGREHALAWKIAQSPLVKNIFVAPGNAGTKTEFTNLEVKLNDFEGIASIIKENEITLFIIGPEQPLVDGLVDFLKLKEDVQLRKVCIVGPDKICSALEGSKDFSKKIMLEAGIPTAKAKIFTAKEWGSLTKYIKNHPLPVVIKADGLAAGKGVAVCQSHKEALDFSRSVLLDEIFGLGGSSILVEEFLDGIEVSMFLLSDGIHYQLLPEAKDYKRIYDGDQGPNTGGMGSVSPVWFVDQEFIEKVKGQIIDPLFKTLKKRGMSYTGFLFIGLMKVGADPFVIEFNTRLGDPETQTLMTRIENDFVPVLLSIKDQSIDKFSIKIKSDCAATVVICAENYPETPSKGDVISFDINKTRGKIFHAGTLLTENQIRSNGGRVIAATSSGRTLNEAVKSAYELVDCIQFKGMQYRKDIGKDVINKAL